MSEKKYTFSLDTNKILTAIVIASVMGIAKIGMDVWAFSQTIPRISKKLQKHDEELLAFGSQLNEKADRNKLEKVDKKLDQIKTILCTMGDHKPTDCIK